MTLSRQDLYDHDYDAFDHIPPKKVFSDDLFHEMKI
jgi:hypothetical protein